MGMVPTCDVRSTATRYSLCTKIKPHSILYSFLLFRCSYMVINVVSVQHNGGFLPEIILLTLCDNIGEPF